MEGLKEKVFEAEKKIAELKKQLSEAEGENEELALSMGEQESELERVKSEMKNKEVITNTTAEQELTEQLKKKDEEIMGLKGEIRVLEKAKAENTTLRRSLEDMKTRYEEALTEGVLKSQRLAALEKSEEERVAKVEETQPAASQVIAPQPTTIQPEEPKQTAPEVKPTEEVVELNTEQVATEPLEATLQLIVDQLKKYVIWGEVTKQVFLGLHERRESDERFCADDDSAQPDASEQPYLH